MKLNYVLNENNTLKSYTIIPFDELKPFIEISDNQVIRIGVSKIVDGIFYSNEEEYQTLINARKELKEILAWFKETDYYPNKIITGEWSSDCVKWVNYLNERTIKRQRYDELVEVLKAYDC